MPYKIKDSLPISTENLYDAVRAGFILKGLSLAKWCKENNVVLETARQTLAGLRRGDAAEELKKRIIEAAGILEESTDGKDTNTRRSV